MDIRDQISTYLNTSWKKSREDTPHSGHNLVKFGEWTRENGFVKKDKASYVQGTIDIVVPCPVIAIVDTKIRREDLNLRITGKNADYEGTETFDQLGTAITKKVYKEGSTTIQTTLLVPRLTRPTAVFFLSGLGNKIYEITNVIGDLLPSIYGGGKVSFYGLASEGSKVFYYLGMYKTHNTIKQIVNSIWMSPEKCPICGGDGLIGNTTCPECLGYGYMGDNASRGIAIAKGYDVRISRQKFAEYPLTDAQWDIVWKFVNKSWTQYWWVTPTVSEIKRLFAHFYNVNEGEIYITERFHFSMPHWDISIPIEGSLGSPFDAGETDLAKFIAESVTPAGVNVFIGFYKFQQIGDLDELTCACVEARVGGHIIERKLTQSAFTSYEGAELFGRYAVWNGWCECVDNFEGDLSKWNSSGVVDIFNVNDIGRHWCRFTDNSYIETKTGYEITTATGSIDLWIHPQSTNLRIGARLSGVNLWAFYVDFKNNGFYDHNDNLIRSAMFDNDFHLQISFIADQYLGGQLGYIDNIKINLESVDTGIQFLNAMAPGRPVRIQSSGVGFSFVDNFGGDWVSGYVAGNNWPRLYPWGWGPNHLDCLSGVSNLYEDYFRKDRIININVSGVC